MSSNILLSICTSARNDNYCGNFKYRLETTLNHLGENIRKLKLADQVEIVVTDWNSDEILGEAISLNDTAGTVARFIRVPPAVAKPHNPPGKHFNNSLAVNVYLRRARGEYIMCIPSDVLISESSLRNLIDLLAGKLNLQVDIRKCLLGITRKYIPWQFIETEPTLEEIDRYLLLNSWMFSQELDQYPGICGGMGSILMNRELWEECRGIDESLAKWGWSDIDLGLRLSRKYPLLVLAHLGIDCYEMNINNDVRNLARRDCNPSIIKEPICPNSESWGLNDIHFEEYRAVNPHKPVMRKRGGIDSKPALLRDMRDSTVAPLVAEHLLKGTFPIQTWPAVFLLSYFIDVYKPRTFVDCGFTTDVPSNVVILLCPWIDYIGIGDLCPTPGEKLIAHTCVMRDTFQYRGHLRIINGKVDHALPDYIDREGKRLELIFFDSNTSDSLNPGFSDFIIRHMDENSALIVRMKDLDSFKSITSHLAMNYPKSILVKSYRHQVFMFLNAKANSGNSPAVLEEATEEACFNSLLMSKLQGLK